MKEEGSNIQKQTQTRMATSTREMAVLKLADLGLSDELTLKLERAIYNYTILRADTKKVPKFWDSQEFRTLYKEKLRSILFNLKNPKTPHLLAELGTQTLTPKKLLEMTPQEMHPDLWKPYYDRIKYREVINGRAENVPEGILQCGKCRSKRVAWYQMQTRSADEPMTVFATCAECGKRWKS
jgi:transcription elongation factor S-II